MLKDEAESRSWIVRGSRGVLLCQLLQQSRDGVDSPMMPSPTRETMLWKNSAMLAIMSVDLSGFCDGASLVVGKLSAY
jgi:hypothetical protein